MIRSAVISPCGQYRYRLDRRWGDGPTLGFIMLNPSTADAEIDDATIRRCMGFARREGCGGIQVVNLFAYRATDPAHLLTVADPIGPENDLYVRSLKGPVVAAWGAHPMARKGFFGRHLLCLGKTKDGYPRHPLYVHRDAPLIDYSAIDLLALFNIM